jgi:small GTP-binding protein
MSGHKVVLLGSEGVGKTAILNRFITNTFSMGAAPTLGVAHSTITVQVRGDPVDLVIWDTAGQEKFSAFVPMYCRSAKVGIIVVSVVNPESVESVARWRDRLYEGGNRPSIIIAINKTDLCESAPARIHEVRAQLADWAYVYCVSALTGDCVDQLFVQAGALAVEHPNPELGSALRAAPASPEEGNNCSC